MPLKKLALFDFDGTITTDDSLIKFIRFVVDDTKFMWGMTLLSQLQKTSSSQNLMKCTAL